MIKKTMRAEMRTPVVIARKAKRIRIFRATATRAPVQAPVPGSGMATRVISPNQPYLSTTGRFLSTFCSILVMNFLEKERVFK